MIDNGNHLVLSGNEAVMRYIRAIGAEKNLVGPDEAAFAFADVLTGARWLVRPNASPLPWWIMSAQRRVPQTRLADYLAMVPLLRKKDVAIGAELARHGAIWSQFIEPVLLAALNTDPVEGSGLLAANVIWQSLGRGGNATCPRIAHPTLAEAFVDPTLAYLARNAATVHLSTRVQKLGFDGARLTHLDLGGEAAILGQDDRVILAVPPWIAETLVPDLVAPNEYRAILNAHFAFTLPESTPAILGLIGGTAQWLFRFDDRCSITVSAADALLERDRTELAAVFWQDVCRAANIDAPLPAWQIVKERRATFAATPPQNARRPKTRTQWPNLALAGDWTDTGLPATIEGALRSGEAAAAAILE
jgi:squalene-associated FAD-dependent desaturase